MTRTISRSVLCTAALALSACSEPSPGTAVLPPGAALPALPGAAFPPPADHELGPGGPSSTPPRLPAAFAGAMGDRAGWSAHASIEMPPTSNVVAQLTSTEMVPISIWLRSPGAVVVSHLPRGALYSAADDTLRWIPQRGQAGRHEIHVRAEGSPHTQILDLVIEPIREAVLDRGPLELYRDGEIGVVFVHGKSDRDMCQSSGAVAEYWGGSPQILAPEAEHRRLACYDGRDSVADSAPQVAQQILDASCGSADKCVIVTHSMGGLILDHILSHARPAAPSDPEPRLFAQHEIYRKVRERALFVVAMASAVGGSKAADIVIHPGDYSVGQQTAGKVAEWFGIKDGSTRSLLPQRATVLAPLAADPGVMVYLVPGFSTRVLDQSTNAFSDLWQALLDSGERAELFNGRMDLATLDVAVGYAARSDGLVSFRSACGIADGNIDGGPGHDASLAAQLAYCARTPKRPRHRVWFAINLNHVDITLSDSDICTDGDNPCRAYLPSGNSLAPDSALDRLTAIEVIRKRLIQPRADHALRRLAGQLDLRTGAFALQ